MCGIVGIANFNNESIDPFLLREMTSLITHRGPDDEGHVILKGKGQRAKTIEFRDPYEARGKDLSGYNAGLGFRRLSIIDLSSAGHQPMSNEDGSIWIVFNGEFYNFLYTKKLRIRWSGAHDRLYAVQSSASWA